MKDLLTQIAFSLYFYTSLCGFRKVSYCYILLKNYITLPSGTKRLLMLRKKLYFAWINIDWKKIEEIYSYIVLFFFSDIPMLQLTIDMNMFNWQNNFAFMNLILLLQPLEKVKIYILCSEKLLFSIRICIFI